MRSKDFRLFLCRRACSRSTPSSAEATATIFATFDTYHQVPGLRWPVVDGKETQMALPRRLTSLREEGRRGTGSTVTLTARPFLLTHCPTSPRPRRAGQGISVLAVYRTGTRALAFRFDDAPGTGALSAFRMPCVTCIPRTPRRWRAARRGGGDCIAARHHEDPSRDARAARASSGTGLRTVVRREPVINKLTLDATDPISLQTDFKKCAVKIVKV